MTSSLVLWLIFTVGQLPPPIAQFDPTVHINLDLENLIMVQEHACIRSHGPLDAIDLIDPKDYFTSHGLAFNEQAMLNELAVDPNTAPGYIRQLLAIKWLGANKIGKAAPGLHRLELSPSQFVRAYAVWALPKIGHRPRQQTRHVGWQMADGLQSFPQNIDGLIWLGLPQLTEARPLTEKERDLLFGALDLDTEALYNFVDIAGNVRIDAMWVAVREKNVFLHIKGRASAPWLEGASAKFDPQVKSHYSLRYHCYIIEHPNYAAALFDDDFHIICNDLIIAVNTDPQQQRKPIQLLQECLEALGGRIPSAMRNRTITQLMRARPNTVLSAVLPANAKDKVLKHAVMTSMNMMGRADGSLEWHMQFTAKPGTQPNTIVHEIRKKLTDTTNEIVQLRNRPIPPNGVQTPVVALNQLAESIRQTRITAHGARVTMTLELPVVPLSLEFIENNRGVPVAPVNAPPAPLPPP